jgi:predicted HicB family RNase H-like nuclease
MVNAPSYKRFTYRVTWSEEHGEYVGLCTAFPSLSRLDPISEHAVAGIRKLVAECVSDMKAAGEVPPRPLASRDYSGKFIVRVPPQLHRKLATQAAEAGVSLNRLVSHKLAD